ncbi:MAG: hypothetical protein IPM29_25550 [Planctomycetes bacterium]|nr:hypothetical protein [Planctomycetota bacterium]
MNMDIRDYYGETKWCDHCREYVHFLMSVNRSYCVHCGNPVRLFSKEDSRRFNADVQKKKWRAV